MFKALMDYTLHASYSWHTPGHGGGVAFRKSPVGQLFYQFFGENTLRSDISVSVGQLGSLLDHTGPIGAGERNAARIFGTDETLFVVGGTSTANKIVWHGMVTRGDLVLCDRNCHKSILHSLIMTGATPIYLVPSRNGLGIIGPISREQFTPESIRAKRSLLFRSLRIQYRIGERRCQHMRQMARSTHQFIVQFRRQPQANACSRTGAIRL